MQIHVENIIADDLYYTVLVLVFAVVAFDLGLLIGWIVVY
jgi:hypothetical protein